MKIKRNRNFLDFRVYMAANPPAPDPVTIDVTASEPGGIGADIDPVVTPPAATENKIDWNTVIPEDMREKEYFKNILKNENPGLELVKQFDNAQSLIGKKATGRPADDASEEDWNKYLDSVRPKTADEYDIPPVDLGDEKKELAEKINSFRTDERVKAIKELAHKYGLPKKEFEGFAKAYEQMQASEYEAAMNNAANVEAQSNQYFDDLAKKTFGNDKDKMLAFGEAAINKATTPEQREMLKALPEGKLPSEALMVIAAIAAKYEKPDSFDTVVGKPGSSIEDLKAQMNELQASKAYRDPFASDHETTRAKVTALSKQIAESSKKQ
jgi:hypothetical protein